MLDHASRYHPPDQDENNSNIKSEIESLSMKLNAISLEKSGKVQALLFHWVRFWTLAELEQAQNSCEPGQQCNMIALDIFCMQVYKVGQYALSKAVTEVSFSAI